LAPIAQVFLHTRDPASHLADVKHLFTSN